MIRKYISYYSARAPYLLVYMLQQSDYNSIKFIKWLFSYPNLDTIQIRGKIVLTNRAKLMLFVGYGSWLLALVITVYLLLQQNIISALVLLFVPDIVIVCTFILNFVIQYLVVNPSHKNEIQKAKNKLDGLDATKIAVLGSYGKTTMKELLSTVLSEAKKVAVTPGNKNVLVSHARWINKTVTGDDEVLIFEYGEAEPGDISTLVKFSKPNIAVITGIAPAHMDAYPNLDAIVKDFSSISSVVETNSIYLQNQKILKSEIPGITYDENGLSDYKVSKISIDITGTKFTLQYKDTILELQSGLLGVHQIGPLTAVVDIARKLGLTDKQIISGVSKTLPFEHRMQPRPLGGAWLIDDTYNGNIEGMRAGLALLKTLSAKRKIYVTPGLVDQGSETERVHVSLGGLIASAKPDKTILMKNSVTKYIQKGLAQSNYDGEVEIESDPLEFYNHLEHFIATGDLLLMQNDWPDSYR